MSGMQKVVRGRASHAGQNQLKSIDKGATIGSAHCECSDAEGCYVYHAAASSLHFPPGFAAPFIFKEVQT